jgi:demethylmenaquinone methyltransferase / 2-methoxy-6-polyprenyl-1,4-benzoquinol methylase
VSWIKNDARRTTFLRLLSPGPNDKILDIGAGKGDVAALVQQSGSCEVHALDPDKKRIELAQKVHPNVKTCLSGSESIPYEDGFFDRVYSTMAVHHYANQEKSFKEIARVLKPGGVLVIADISPRRLLGKIGQFFENTIMRSHLRFLNQEELVAMLGREGEFVVKETEESGPGYFVQAVKTTIPS